MNEYTIILILLVHFIADFIMQSDNMAKNKSRDVSALASHVGVYAMCMLVFGPMYAAVNGAAHFLIDGITSKITAHLYKRGQRHWFFVVIGLDQFLHAAVLILSAGLISTL